MLSKVAADPLAWALENLLVEDGFPIRPGGS